MSAVHNPAACPPTSLAVIGAGPVGLSLALWAARAWPHTHITLLDARAGAVDPERDPRVLALSLGSVNDLQRLGAWDARAAQPITEVRVSQTPGSRFAGAAALRIRADEERVPLLGAVVRYGTLLAQLQAAWERAQAQAPERLSACFGHSVNAIDGAADGVTVHAEHAEQALSVDLAVVAEGGVWGAPTGAALHTQAVNVDYAQTAWVGQVQVTGLEAGVALERFTPDGPVALLPLPLRLPLPAGAQAGAPAPYSLVWCVRAGDDPVRALGAAQRVALLNERLRGQGVRVESVGELRSFALGLSAARTLVSGRVVRIGNAAQTLHPVAGQGLNLGLRDAHTVVHALRDASDLNRALRRIEWQRASDRWSMIAATDFLARSFTWRAPGVSSARSLALAALQALPPLRSALARRMMFGRR